MPKIIDYEADRGSVLSLLKREPMSSDLIAAELGWKMTRTRRVLKELRQDGRIRKAWGVVRWRWDYYVVPR